MHKTNISPIHKWSLLFVFMLFISQAYAQKAKLDSLRRLYLVEETETRQVELLWRMASAASVYNPDTAFTLSFEAIAQARENKDIEGQSRATGIMANVFMRIGNYPKALELNIEKLKLEEKRDVPLNYASVLINIGIVYALQEEYQKALYYYNQSDSIIQLHNLESISYNLTLNTGDTYDRLNQSENAFKYFSRSLAIATAENDGDLIGTSLIGMGHSYRKMKNYTEAINAYHRAIQYLRIANDHEMLCEANLGLAKLYRDTDIKDSARYYANRSINIAKSGFQSKELEAAIFLTDHYKKLRNFDSAFAYVDYSRALNDSINSKNNIRKSQIISSNENLRQLELASLKKKEAKERSTQLQLLFIAIFIPLFFLLTLLLSRINLSIKVIRVLGILSLLFFFEFLTLLIHPTVANITHHTPIYEIFILVGLAAFIIPLHHKMEHWIIHKLLHKRMAHAKKEAADKEDNEEGKSEPA